jgi:hypothetical protein
VTVGPASVVVVVASLEVVVEVPVAPVVSEVVVSSGEVVVITEVVVLTGLPTAEPQAANTRTNPAMRKNHRDMAGEGNDLWQLCGITGIDRDAACGSP